MFIFSGLFRVDQMVKKLIRFKITANTFAGVYITGQIEKQSHYNVVLIN